ncbi:hypothetical protein ACFLZE_04060 [Thermodesulfobacteriota bacterium]
MNYKRRLIVCFVSMLLIYCLYHFISKQTVFVKHAEGYFGINDYAYYIIIAKTFWFEGLGNIYKLSFQQHAVSAYIGSNVNTVMPLGITPIALVVWFPFAFAARFSMALSYTLWVAFSFGILFTALWKVGRYVFQVKKLELLPIMLSFVTILSVTMGRTLLLGQTSVLATGLLIYLIYFVHKTAKEFKSGSWLPVLPIIFLLAIKPTYLALGLGLLIIYGMWQQAIYSAIAVLFVLICITPILTTDWILSYLHQLRTFGGELIPDAYAWAFAPHTMNIFRSAFRNMIGDNLAGLISTIVTCGFYIGIVGISLSAKLKGKSTNRLSPLSVTKGQLFVLMIASYLLFAPYAGGYEDILLLSVFITVLLIGNPPNLLNYKSILLIGILFLILSHNAFPPNKPLWVFWIFKAVLLGYMLKFCGFPKERNE